MSDPHWWDISGTVGITDVCPHCSAETVLEESRAENFNACWMASAWTFTLECPECGTCWELIATAMVHRTGNIYNRPEDDPE